jgi:putative tryptophan/tyrosine transport system ATP-binding protein
MIKIEINNISFSYQIGYNSFVKVLKDLSFNVKSGDIIGLIGKNGSGKTTLLNILKGDIQPVEGSKNIILENGEKKNLNQFIPLVSQNVDSNLFPTLTVFENFCIIKKKERYPLKKYSSKKNIQYCQEILSKADMDIENKINEQVRFLSGGQKQAISILFSLEQEFPILLMDEPTASLDPFVSKIIIELAKSEISKRNGILFIVSHNIHDIIKYSSKILILSNGQIKEYSTSKNMNETELIKLM